MSADAKAVLYYFSGSVWAAVPLLTAEEKGYTDDELERRFVDLLKGENFAPAYLRISPNGTVPALVAPYEHTVGSETPTKFKALTSSTEIAKFLDEATLAPNANHAAPKLSPATVQGASDAKFFIDLVHKADAPDPNFLLLSLRNDDERKGKNGALPGDFLRGRQAALEKYQQEVGGGGGDGKLKAFYEQKIKENGGLLAIYEGKADASGFYQTSQEAYRHLSKLVALIEGKLNTTYLVGDQISLADIHVGAYFARILAVVGAQSLSQVADGSAFAKLNAQLEGARVGPKLEAYLKNLFERQSFKKTYAENLH